MEEYKYECVKVKVRDGIAWASLNRPEKRNAMSPALHADCVDALKNLATDPETKVLVLTGAGEAYCAGQDLKLFFRGTEGKAKERFESSENSHNWRWQRLSKFPKPTIAMVNGFCFGGAFVHLIGCDLAIAAEEATFGLSEVNWGIIPGGSVSWNVVDLVNFRNAMYYAMTGDPFDGKIAAQMGLVNFAVPKAKLREETVKLAKKLMEKNPAALRYTKEAIRAVRGMDEAQANDYLAAKSDALRFRDTEGGREIALAQFVDEKLYRPGLGNYVRDKDEAAAKKAAKAKS
jgi:trans-feruloyl-CoA hydratase/vanillin synthase